ncbi:uncharacterized protein M421DRAFT_424871 [Didymella exigua CBS 183.55]|uniref:F-box domain-containing protein n=1 Tax=Didymella exigua CBS 183.55 TaxID=1150837 RepID=A0A6A5R9N3_9PLEO|nr:uncharacterized protein M421DRAFT_424871 [Didymella exigua CBS 183.55]KAF1924233.1 hypothetical protein M421DRAFT_424871 [Didymella exigua CBS 183.55]
MTTNTERDAFGRLPEELRIKIIKLSPDPLSLQNLAHASPAMGRVLDKYALEIVEVVLDVTVPVQTRRLMGAVLKARFSRFPASLSEAQKVAKTDSTVATDEMRSSGTDRAAAAVWSLLATAEIVHAWSYACLEHLVRKSMELRPSTLIKKGPGRTSREQFENAESRKDYLPQCTGLPSWVEEQRMIKSFWRLQFFLELQGASNKGRLGTCWLGQEVEALSKSSPDGFYNMFSFEQEQTLTACDFLGAVTSGAINLVAAVHNNAYRLPTIRWIEGAVPRCSYVEPPSFKRNKDNFFQGPENLDANQMSYHFQRFMSSCDQYEDAGSVLLAFPFQPWRKYGFAIWDGKRMADLGMRDPKGKSFLRNRMKYSFRWFSILTEEDLRDLP